VVTLTPLITPLRSLSAAASLTGGFDQPADADTQGRPVKKPVLIYTIFALRGAKGFRSRSSVFLGGSA
jgi:hypothetical protein